MKTLYFKEINAYGSTLYKPVNDVAHLLTTLTGNRTMNPRQLSTLKTLGYTIEFVNEFNSIKVL